MAHSADAFILVDNIPEMAQSDGESTEKSIFKGIGKYDVDIDEFPDLLGHTLMEAIGRARTEMEVINLSDGIILPLGDVSNMAIGAIYVSGVDAYEAIKLLQIYANQAASSINNAFLHSLVNTKNEELNNTYAQLKIRYMDTIEVLRLAVDAKDEYTRGHSDRVAYYATKIGQMFKLPQSDIEKLEHSGCFSMILEKLERRTIFY